MDVLSQNDLLALLELGVACTRVRTRSQLAELLQRLRPLLPCVAAELMQLRSTASQRQAIYRVELALQSSPGPLWPAWSGRLAALDRVLGPAAPEWALIEEAGPVGGMGHRILVVSLEASRGSVAGRTLLCLQLGGRVAIERVRQALGYLLPHLQQAAMRLAAEVNPQRTIRLSTRQHEVLRWLREGKTTWEISRILGIAERTVKFHVANLCLRLNANNRLHALARARQLDLLH